MELFKRFDIDDSGTIELDELARVLQDFFVYIADGVGVIVVCGVGFRGVRIGMGMMIKFFCSFSFF